MVIIVDIVNADMDHVDIVNVDWNQVLAIRYIPGSVALTCISCVRIGSSITREILRRCVIKLLLTCCGSSIPQCVLPNARVQIYIGQNVYFPMPVRQCGLSWGAWGAIRFWSFQKSHSE